MQSPGFCLEGGGSGIGAETVRVLVLRGCHVIIGGRILVAANETKKNIMQENAGGHLLLSPFILGFITRDELEVAMKEYDMGVEASIKESISEVDADNVQEIQCAISSKTNLINGRHLTVSCKSLRLAVAKVLLPAYRSFIGRFGYASYGGESASKQQRERKQGYPIEEEQQPEKREERCVGDGGQYCFECKKKDGFLMLEKN